MDSEGRFRFDSRDVPGSVARWRALLASDGVVLDQVEREFWAQVKRFRGYGLSPTTSMPTITFPSSISTCSSGTLTWPTSLKCRSGACAIRWSTCSACRRGF